MDENISKIQYLSATGTKIYKVTDIDFHNLIIEATETDLSIADVPESEVFPIEEFGEFRIRLINGGGGSGALRPFGRTLHFPNEITLSRREEMTAFFAGFYANFALWI